MELLEENPRVLTQFVAGELEAFEMLFRQFQPEVYRWIIRIVRDPAAAEDLTRPSGGFTAGTQVSTRVAVSGRGLEESQRMLRSTI